MNLDQIHLVLFLSRSTSLDRWNKMGVFERELKFYKELSQELGKISLVTSGGKEDLIYQKQLGDISLLYNRWGFSPNLYSLLAPILHWSALRAASIYKTNQLDGAWTAIIAGKLHHKPVIVRAGYLWADNLLSAGGKRLKTRIIQYLQSFSLNHARTIIVTTAAMEKKLRIKYKISKNKLRVVPNYVDTEIFKPNKAMKIIRGRICFVGRLHPDKNLKNLVKALSEVPDCCLIIIGDGEQLQELEALAETLQIKAIFSGIVPHSRIPDAINCAEIFILPSLYEGHPKALIEAMACGKPVIGSDAPGIRELIVHGETGLLCHPDIESIREAIQRLLSDRKLQEHLGQNASHYVLKHFDLKRVEELELEAIKAAINSNDPAF